MTRWAVVLALVLAGCGGPSGTRVAPVPTAATPGGTTAPPGSIASTVPPSLASGPSALAEPAERAPLPRGVVVDGIPSDVLKRALAISTRQARGDGSTVELVLETSEEFVVLDASSRGVSAMVPRPVAAINAVVATDDSIWVTDHDGGAVLRLDRATGRTKARIEIGGRAVSLLETEAGIWAGSAHVIPASVSLIDPATNSVRRRLEVGAFPAFDGVSLWFGRDAVDVSTTVRQVDPATGTVKGTIDIVEPQQGCYVGGIFPGSVWSWCLEEWWDTKPTRLDLEAMRAVATVPLQSGGGLMGVTTSYSLFDADAKTDLPARLVVVDNATNMIERVYLNDMPLAIAGNELWILDARAGVLRTLALDRIVGG